MRARMGTQSESLKPSFTHSKSENATRHRRSQLSIRYFSDARPTETKRPMSTCPPSALFPSICGIRLRRTATESSRQRVRTFSRRGRSIARRAAGATEQAPTRVRSARATKRAKARGTPARGSGGGGWFCGTRGNASAVRVTSASDVGRPWRAPPPTRCTYCSWMTTA